MCIVYYISAEVIFILIPQGMFGNLHTIIRRDVIRNVSFQLARCSFNEEFVIGSQGQQPSLYTIQVARQRILDTILVVSDLILPFGCIV